MFKELLNKGKDNSISLFIKTILNKKIKNIGTIITLKVNKEEKKIILKVALKGELEALRINIETYELQEIETNHYLVLSDIQTSKVWINALIKEYLYHKRIKLPSKYIKSIKTIL